MADEQKTISEDEKALIRLIKIACIGFILFSILGSLGAFATHYYKMQKVKRTLSQFSNQLSEITKHEQQRQKAYNTNLPAPKAIHLQPMKEPTEITIQSKTYQNESMIKDSSRHLGCVYSEGKRVCLE